MNHELTNIQAGFRIGRVIKDQNVNICWVIEKEREFQEISTSASTMLKALTVCITTNWKILHETGIPDHLTCLLRTMYASQEATVRTGHGTIDWFQIRKADIKALYCHLTFELVCRIHHAKSWAG